MKIGNKVLKLMLVGLVCLSMLGCTRREPSNPNTAPNNSYIGFIEVEGTISSEVEDTLFSAAATYRHEATLDFIDRMAYDINNKGLLIYINSPGGTVYDSDELYLKLMEYKQRTNRPIWVYMGPMACSGGYYISMAADKIVANRNTWTGSIGVIIQVQDISGLLSKLGIEIDSIVSGKNKDMASGFREMTKEERAILQSLVDEAYEQFVEIVSVGRSMSIEDVKKLADGRIYTAKQALEAKLIDEIAGYDETVLKMLAELGASGLYEMEPPAAPSSIFDQLFMSGGLSLTEAQILELLKILEAVKPAKPMYMGG